MRKKNQRITAMPALESMPRHPCPTAEHDQGKLGGRTGLRLE